MQYKNLLKILSVLAALVFIIGILFVYPETINVCTKGDDICGYQMAQRVGIPTSIFSLAFLLIFIVLLFRDESIIKIHLKYIVLVVPIGFLLILLTPSTCNAPLGLCLTRGAVSFVISLVYFLVSISVIIVKSIKIARLKNFP